MPKTDVFCLWMRILPQKVTAVAVSSGKVVHGVSLRRDEGVGSPRGHKHICNHSVFRFTRTPTRRQPDNSPPIISSNSDFYFAPTDLERELKAWPWSLDFKERDTLNLDLPSLDSVLSLESMGKHMEEG